MINDNRKRESETVIISKHTVRQPRNPEDDGSWITSRSIGKTSDDKAGRGQFGVPIPISIRADSGCADLHNNHSSSNEAADIGIKVVAKSDRMSQKAMMIEACALKVKALEEILRLQLDSLDNDDDDAQKVAVEVGLLSMPEAQESLMVPEGK